MGDRLPPGQVAILQSFKKAGPNSLYVASDILDLRVVYAMIDRGLLNRFGDNLFELTDLGTAAVEALT